MWSAEQETKLSTFRVHKIKTPASSVEQHGALAVHKQMFNNIYSSAK